MKLPRVNDVFIAKFLIISGLTILLGTALWDITKPLPYQSKIINSK